MLFKELKDFLPKIEKKYNGREVGSLSKKVHISVGRNDVEDIDDPKLEELLVESINSTHCYHGSFIIVRLKEKDEKENGKF